MTLKLKLFCKVYNSVYFNKFPYSVNSINFCFQVYTTSDKHVLLWQLLITKTNNHTSGKSLKLDIKWEVHKKTRQGVSAKLESYIYKVHMVHATFSYPPHSLLKAIMLYTYALISSF